MLRYSLIHPMPNGDTFHISSHKEIKSAFNKMLRVKVNFWRHPKKYDNWFEPKKICIRDNQTGKIVFKEK